MGAVAVRIAPVSVRRRPGLARPSPSPPSPPRASPEELESKKAARIFPCAVSTQSDPKRWFSSLPWVLKMSIGAV